MLGLRRPWHANHCSHVWLQKPSCISLCVTGCKHGLLLCLIKQLKLALESHNVWYHHCCDCQPCYSGQVKLTLNKALDSFVFLLLVVLYGGTATCKTDLPRRIASLQWHIGCSSRASQAGPTHSSPLCCQRWCSSTLPHTGSSCHSCKASPMVNVLENSILSFY